MEFKASIQRLFVHKIYTPDDVLTSDLKRVLSLIDLVALGAFATLGVGLYVVAGDLARNKSGPGVVVSFVFASILSAVCYAEFACRVPRAGSAYVYTYVTIGELMAFVIGWNMILEYAIGTASVARALVYYVDSLPGVDHAIEKYCREKMPIDSSSLAKYPDFIAFFFVLLVTVWIAWGVKESAIINNVFSLLSIITIVIVIVAGAVLSEVKNWSIPIEAIPEKVRNTKPDDGGDGGKGGFLPYGFVGVMKGAAVAFNAFIGFDAIATAGEEAKNPGRNIPLAIVCCSYLGVTVVLTMMLPYYEQDVQAPLPHAFRAVGQPALAWVMTTGAMFALITLLFGSMFPLPRIVYSMANDGLIFEFLARVHPKTQTPVIATCIVGTLSGISANLFDLEHLIDMMSIGTLFSYTIVAVSVMILRYEHPDSKSPEYTGLQETTREGRLRLLDHIFNISRRKYPTLVSSRLTKCFIGIFCVLQLILCAFFVFAPWSGTTVVRWEFLLPMSTLLVAILIMLVILALQPSTTHMLTFKVPLLPFTTALIIMINTYLMLLLKPATWIRFVLWLILGLLIYFFYGMSHSVESLRLKAERADPQQT